MTENQRKGGMDMLHVTIGDGAGKTTAAVGLAVRAAGRGRRVLFVQFLKDGSSGEIAILRKLETVTVLHAPVHYGFLSRMTAEQRRVTAAACSDLLDAVLSYGASGVRSGGGLSPGAGPGADLVVLDEVLHALDAGLIRREDLEPVLAQNWELVLTGRTAPEWLMEQADYVSEVRKGKHPFDRGVRAREGIEF